MLQAPTDWLQGLRPWRGPGGQSPGLTSLPGFSGPETDMRSVLVHLVGIGDSVGAATTNRVAIATVAPKTSTWRFMLST
jgi:hypothetical protein